MFPRVCREFDIADPVAEHRFAPPRRWRMDWAWPDHKLALEVQGGIFVAGRHSRGAAMLKEWEKLNTAAAMGWRFLFCQPADLYRTETLALLRQALSYGQAGSHSAREIVHGVTS